MNDLTNIKESATILLKKRYLTNNHLEKLNTLENMLSKITELEWKSDAGKDLTSSLLSSHYPDVFLIVEKLVPSSLLNDLILSPYPLFEEKLNSNSSWLHYAVLKNNVGFTEWLIKNNVGLQMDSNGQTPIFLINSPKMLNYFFENFSNEPFLEKDEKGVSVFQNWLWNEDAKPELMLNYVLLSKDKSHVDEILQSITYTALNLGFLDAYSSVVNSFKDEIFTRKIDFGRGAYYTCGDILALSNWNKNSDEHKKVFEHIFHPSIEKMFLRPLDWNGFVNQFPKVNWKKSENSFVLLNGLINSFTGHHSKELELADTKYKNNLSLFLKDLKEYYQKEKKDIYAVEVFLHDVLIASFLNTVGNNEMFQVLKKINNYFDLSSIPFLELIKEVNPIRKKAFLGESSPHNSYISYKDFDYKKILKFIEDLKSEDALKDSIKFFSVELSEAQRYSWLFSAKDSLNVFSSSNPNVKVDMFFGWMGYSLLEALTIKYKNTAKLNDLEVYFLKEMKSIEALNLFFDSEVDKIEVQMELQNKVTPNVSSSGKQRF